MLVVCGQYCMPNGGFNMGTALGPGGATLLAADAEEEQKHSRGRADANEFENKVLALRWMDDLVFAVPKWLSQAAKDLVNAMTSEYFYGPTLKLKIVGGETAFGFKFNLETGRVLVNVAPRFVSCFLERFRIRGWSAIQGVHGFQPKYVRKGLIGGFLLRVLDYSNDNADSVEASLIRLVLELRGAGYPPKDILRGLRQIRVISKQNFSGVDEFVNMSEMLARLFAVMWDAVDWLWDTVRSM